MDTVPNTDAPATPAQPPLLPRDTGQPPLLSHENDPDWVAHAAMQKVIDQKTQDGSLVPSASPAQQGTLYDINSFLKYLNVNQAVVPPFKGAAVSDGGWFDQASQAIGGTEGFDGRAYHGVYSPLRKPGDIHVKPGEVNANTASEVSIGYGYNLTGNKDSRDVFKSQLGFSDSDYDAVLNGQKSITPDQALQLRGYMIYQANAYLSNMVKAPLTDYQRAALVSMVYNFGPGGFRKTGIPDAINKGETPAQVAQLIQNASPNQKKLQSRRNAEAQLFLGTKGGASLVAATQSNYLSPQSAGADEPEGS
jgi:GH24 family phage-related lysozyme (muramidase)